MKTIYLVRRQRDARDHLDGLHRLGYDIQIHNLAAERTDDEVLVRIVPAAEETLGKIPRTLQGLIADAIDGPGFGPRFLDMLRHYCCRVAQKDAQA